MEHIGWDEEPREPRKILRTLENLRLNCFASGGKMVITLPLGQNPELDKLLDKGKIDLGKQYYMKRISKSKEWIEVEWNDVRNIEYNTPSPYANGIVISCYQMTF